MPGMPKIHWYNAKLTEGRIGSCANLYNGTGIVICPISSLFWPVFRDRFPLLSTRFPQLCKTGPLDSMGTLTVFFMTFPRFENPDISRSEIYIYIYIYIYICWFSAKIRLKTAERWLKAAQNTWNTLNRPSRGANKHPINNLVCPRHHFRAPREGGRKVMPKSWHVAKFFLNSKLLLEFFWKVGFGLGINFQVLSKSWLRLGRLVRLVFRLAQYWKPK